MPELIRYTVPMIPEALIALLACTHIGAVHVVVFGGFAPTECAKRIDSAKPVVILTASCGIEGKRVIPYLPFIREAIGKAAHKPRYVLLHQRPQLRAMTQQSRNEINMDSVSQSARLRNGPTVRPPFPATVSSPDGNIVVELGVALKATDPHYILHTSGTTGTPKGVTRPMSHLVGLSYTSREMLGLGHGDTIACFSDVGWVVGHSFILYAPLLAGAATVMYEGKPIGTPDAGAFWRIVEEYKVNVLYCAPSALRAITREDTSLRGLKNRDITSLRALFLAGERSEPSLIRRFETVIPRVVDSKFSPPTAILTMDSDWVIDWWSTESGSPMTGLIGDAKSRPGSAGKPLPGWDIRVVNDSGEQLPAGEQGNVVLALPLSPTALSGLWGEDERYWASYFQRFEGKWMDTGDIGVMDGDGYLTILARGDDVINVAAHRLGTTMIEGVVAAVDGVAEGYVVPMRDEMKGQVPVAFVVLRPGVAEDGGVKEKIREAVRREVGPIAAVREVLVIPANSVPRTRSGKVVRRAFRALLDGVRDGPEGVESTAWRLVVEKAEESGLLPRATRAML